MSEGSNRDGARQSTSKRVLTRAFRASASEVSRCEQQLATCVVPSFASKELRWEAKVSRCGELRGVANTTPQLFVSGRARLLSKEKENLMVR